MTDAPDDERHRVIDRDLESHSNNRRTHQRTVYSCPDCGGVLWEFDEGFECHTGHRWPPDTLLTQQTQELHSALMAAVRLLTEKATLLRQMARNAAETSASGELLESQAKDLDGQAALIKARLLDA
jgi:two-component system chemotaxis response regulator CheB